MVQHYHLCDDMTLITVQDGAVVMKDGKVGTEQACCCGDQDDCCRCCLCADGSEPTLNGLATADSVTWSGWNGTEYATFDVNLSGKCCCCDLLTDVISGLTNGTTPATPDNVAALFGSAMPGRTANAGDPYTAAWGATASCADFWEFSGVDDPCRDYPDPCVDSWCNDDQECLQFCVAGFPGFATYPDCNPLP